MGSALRGESEPIRRYNVLLNEAAVNAKPLELGLAHPDDRDRRGGEGAGPLRPHSRTDGTGPGGSLATQDSLGNRLKSARVDFENLRRELGEAVLPAVEGFLDAAPELIDAVTALAPALSDAASAAGELAGPLATVTRFLTLNQGGIAGLARVFQEAGEESDTLGGASRRRGRRHPLRPIRRLPRRRRYRRLPARSVTGQRPRRPHRQRVPRIRKPGPGGDHRRRWDQRILGRHGTASGIWMIRSPPTRYAGSVPSETPSKKPSPNSPLSAKNSPPSSPPTSTRSPPLEANFSAGAQAFNELIDDETGEIVGSLEEFVAELTEQIAAQTDFDANLAELGREGSTRWRTCSAPKARRPPGSPPRRSTIRRRRGGGSPVGGDRPLPSRRVPAAYGQAFAQGDISQDYIAQLTELADAAQSGTVRTP